MTKEEFLAKEFRGHCPDCGAGVNRRHTPGCDVERCSECNGQAICCSCDEEDMYKHDPEKVKWTGYWPGVVECVELGYFSKINPDGVGWVKTTIDDPGACADLNRWVLEQIMRNKNEN